MYRLHRLSRFTVKEIQVLHEMTTYQDISISNALGLLGNKSCVIIDIRDEDSFRQGHLPRAVRFNNHFFQQFKKHGKQQTPILIYCYHGITSKDVAQVFCDFGCTNVYSLKGGYAAWQATDLPV